MQRKVERKWQRAADYVLDSFRVSKKNKNTHTYTNKIVKHIKNIIIKSKLTVVMLHPTVFSAQQVRVTMKVTLLYIRVYNCSGS